MPTYIYVNNKEVASKPADGKSIAAFPDVCFSPPAPPVGPMPLPYPNTGEGKDTDEGTAKVFINDKMSGMAGDSYMTKSMGDESATKNFNKGLITGEIQGKCYLGLWSMDVNMEGKGVPRHMDIATHNHGSMVGNTPPNGLILQQDTANAKTCSTMFANKYCAQFCIINENGEPLPKICYKLKLDSGKEIDGLTNSEGWTIPVFTQEQETVHLVIV